MAADHPDDVAWPSTMPRSRSTHPASGFSVIQLSPVSIGGWWSTSRVGRSGCSASRSAASRAGLAKAAAVPPDLERVEHEDPQRIVLDRILDEAVGRRHVREIASGRLPAVMIAHAEADRDWQPASALFSRR
jgi:hypothetical protein